MSLLRVCSGFAILVAGTAVAPRQPSPTYEVYAVRYGTVPNFQVRGLIAGADTSRRMDIAMSVWLLKGNGRTVLVDAGFYRDKFVQRWKPTGFTSPQLALRSINVRPEDVTDIIISHIHWDHADGADLFPNARVWVQQEEYDHHVGAAGEQRDRAIDPDDAQMFAALAKRGRVELVKGDSVEIIPGITVFTGGKHTFASQYATVRMKGGATAVIASDNAYLYENLEKHRPIAQTLDSLSNLAAQQRMMRLASSPRLVVPGHDPAVFVRFPSPGNGVARIQ
ncbi:MAG TPA: N-acyl homoserine lactonase family protein [Gemmatimonadaceae bacterium]|nr:N-acyl homoserine lactonase family protein [Gemmatimonadaceae bacterium]